MSQPPPRRSPSPLQPEDLALVERWRGPLRQLCGAIRDSTRLALSEALAAENGLRDVATVVAEGAGDITFAIDVVAEDAVDAWFEEVSSREPLSLMTEDAGWRHRGPAPGSDGPEKGHGSIELPDFDHGGPRIALDPIDGTRNIMHDLRSAWIVVSFAGPGPCAPRYGDLTHGCVAEIPDSRGAVARELEGTRGAGASVTLLQLGAELPRPTSLPLRAPGDVRFDRGYFPFFAFHPTCRADLQALGLDVFAQLKEQHPDLDLSTVFDDQYISSGGQLALLALGTYRSIVDARHAAGQWTGRPTQTAKPYDMAGAALVAQEAGCVVTDPDGQDLDFPIDVSTPVDFAGFANGPTADGILGALRAALGTRRGNP